MPSNFSLGLKIPIRDYISCTKLVLPDQISSQILVPIPALARFPLHPIPYPTKWIPKLNPNSLPDQISSPNS